MDDDKQRGDPVDRGPGRHRGQTREKSDGQFGSTLPARKRTRGRPPNPVLQAEKRECAKTAFMRRVASVGVASTHIGDVVREAHISTEQWYEWFVSKEAAYLMLFDTCGGKFLADAQRVFEATPGPWEARMRAALELVTAELEAHPVVARFLLEYQNITGGAQALARLLGRAQAVYLTDEVRRSAPPLPPAALDSVAGTLIVEPMRRYIADGQLHRLRELVPTVLYCLTLHLLGPERAAPLRPAPT